LRHDWRYEATRPVDRTANRGGKSKLTGQEVTMPTPSVRALVGFIAAAISVLTFHQGMWATLHVLAIPGLGMPAPYPTAPIPPLGIPQIVNLCFWGGLYGIVFGLLLPRFTAPLWLCGLLLGLIAALVGLLVVPAIKGLPIGSGWIPLNWVRSFLINGFWGLGVGLILPMLMTRVPRRAW
jgi:hypothetical protein